MLSIVDDLKSINQRLQNFLKQRDNERQEKVAQVQSRYNQVVHKITTILDSIVYDFTQALIQKSSHTDKEKEIILQLSKVQAERNKIARFKTIRFSDEEAMRSYLKKSVVSIRRELLKLRDML